MAKIQNYSCPSCGGTVVFDSNIQKMKCPFCDGEYEIDQFTEQDNSKTAIPQKWEDSNVKAYICTSCGGEIICEDTLGATTCPFCSSSIILNEKFSNTLKPDFVIPFKLNKNQAVQSFKEIMAKKKLLSRDFKNNGHLQETQGMYIPFWLYDVHVQAQCVFSAEDERRLSEKETEVSYYKLVREGSMDFEQIPQDGSQKMDDALMDAIGKFDYSQMTEFKSSYLSGFIAEKYDVDNQAILPKVHKIVQSGIENQLAHSINGYSNVKLVSSNAKFTDTKISYALCPIWVLNTNWKNNNYLFAINGQTGKFAGKFPLDKGRFALWLFILTVVFGGILSGILILLINNQKLLSYILGGCGVGFIISLITVLSMKSKLSFLKPESIKKFSVKNSFKLLHKRDILKHSRIVQK